MLGLVHNKGKGGGITDSWLPPSVWLAAKSSLTTAPVVGSRPRPVFFCRACQLSNFFFMSVNLLRICLSSYGSPASLQPWYTFLHPSLLGPFLHQLYWFFSFRQMSSSSLACVFFQVARGACICSLAAMYASVGYSRTMD